MHIENVKASSTDFDGKLMRAALDQALRCKPVPSAYCVGCVVLAGDGRMVYGYSRETSSNDHAEEVALRRAVQEGFALSTATVYTTMEPCGKRASKDLCCADLILQLKINRVVFAALEPGTFSTVSGAQKLLSKGLEVIHLSDCEKEALAIACRDH